MYAPPSADDGPFGSCIIHASRYSPAVGQRRGGRTIHDRLPFIKVFLFELYSIFEISRQEGTTEFQVVEHGMAIFAEYAVDNTVEGKSSNTSTKW